MKRITVFLIAAMIFTLGANPMNTKQNEIILTASQVASAVDIEHAIDTATNYGTRPGIVTLNSSQGDFVYTGDDRSINIYLSNIVLRSKNGAVIKNCGDGVFFDAVPADHVTVQGITFQCEGSGITGGSGHEQVVIRDNTFHVSAYAVGLEDGWNWTITKNRGTTELYAVFVIRSEDIVVGRNQLTGNVGVALDNSTDVQVLSNTINAIWHGVLLDTGSSFNRVISNKIMSTQYSGITFEGKTTYNRVLENQVKCTDGYTCELIKVEVPPLSPTNKIEGNKLVAAEVSKPTDIHATLEPGIWTGFKLGSSANGAVYIVDVNPLGNSLDGACIQSSIKPEYNGRQWNDVLRVRIPAEFPKQKVQITVYKLTSLQPLLDRTDAFPPGEWRGYPIARSVDTTGAYLADLDPLDASVEGATLGRYLIHPELPSEEWMDILRVQTADWLPADPLQIRMRVYLVPNLPLVSDFNATLTKSDTWVGFAIGPSSLQRGYVVRAIPHATESMSDLNQYIIQPEFDGRHWNDVLRVQMGNQDQDWDPIEYNFKVYACDKTACP